MTTSTSAPSLSNSLAVFQQTRVTLYQQSNDAFNRGDYVNLQLIGREIELMDERIVEVEASLSN